MTIVADASAIVAALTMADKTGQWCRTQLGSVDIAAPQLMFVEAANVIRRHELAGHLSAPSAQNALDDLTDLEITYYPHVPLGSRLWELRMTHTCYDAGYVALAEALDAPVMTLDTKLSRAPGSRCGFLTPEQ